MHHRTRAQRPVPTRRGARPWFDRVDTDPGCRARPHRAAPRTSGHCPTRRSSLPAFREEGSALGVRPDVPAGVATQLESRKLHGAEPHPLGSAVRAREPVKLTARFRNRLASGHWGVRALMPLDVARTFRYGQAARTAVVPASATQRPIPMRVVVCRFVQLRNEASAQDQTTV
jgi:hypothetical protein